MSEKRIDDLVAHFGRMENKIDDLRKEVAEIHRQLAEARGRVWGIHAVVSAVVATCAWFLSNFFGRGGS